MRSASFGSIIRQLFFVSVAAVLIIVATQVGPESLPSFAYGAASTTQRLPLVGSRNARTAHSLPLYMLRPLQNGAACSTAHAALSTAHHEAPLLLHRLPMQQSTTSAVSTATALSSSSSAP
jgi:hypothetical protein